MTIGTDIRECFCPSYKSGEVDGFTNRQHINRLVYYESFRYVGRAIERETEIKKWRREKKIALIESFNPARADLAEDWGTHRPEKRRSLTG